MKLSQLKEEIRNIIREVKLEEGFTNPKVSNPTELAKIVLGWFDFYTDYIDDGGQRRRAIQKNDNTLEWFGSHPVDVKEKAYKIILAQAKGDKSKIERTFGKHLKEVVIKEDIRGVKLLDIDFNVSEMNGRILFSFVDKKAAYKQIRKIGTNKIVNDIQKRLDIAYGKDEFFFISGSPVEFQNGYVFQRKPSNINLNKIKFEVITEEKKYDIGSGWMGNGLTIWNRAEEKNGEYKIIAHISKDGTLKIYDKALPNDIKKMFQMWADTMKKGDRPGTY
jgi:hypothetical protein